MRVLIVDDEPLARERLRSLLAVEPDVEVTGECDHGKAALAAVEELAPDVVFMDVQMPGMTGLEAAAAMLGPGMPVLVFVTAHDQYALQAFEAHALAFLVKPVAKDRCRAAVERVRTYLRGRAGGETEARLAAMLRGLGGNGPKRRLPITVGVRTVLQDVDEIDWIEADGRHARVHVAGEARRIRETMQNLEAFLPAGQFLRVSRSAIVNVERIREIQPWFHGTHVLIMNDGSEVPTTRGYRQGVQRLLHPFGPAG